MQHAENNEEIMLLLESFVNASVLSNEDEEKYWSLLLRQAHRIANSQMQRFRDEATDEEAASSLAEQYRLHHPCGHDLEWFLLPEKAVLEMHGSSSIAKREMVNYETRSHL